MKKYCLLIILFIVSVCFVYRDSSIIGRDIYYEDSMYVFYEVDTNIVSNPDTSDIHELIFIIFGYNLILFIMLFVDKKKVVKYEELKF